MWPFKDKDIQYKTAAPGVIDINNFYPVNLFSTLSGNTTKTCDTSTIIGQRNAYIYCPAVTAVVNMKVAMSMNGRQYFSDGKGGEVKNEFQKVIDKQGKQFQMFYKVCVQVFGKSYIYVRKLAGISPYKWEYYVVPNWELTINQSTVTDFFGSKVVNYQWNHNGQQITIQPDEMFIINDTGLDLSSPTGQFNQGGSRLLSLGDAAQNIIAAYEARHSNLTNGGPPVVVSPEKSVTGSSIMLPEHKKELEDRFSGSKSRYGWLRGQKLIAFATQPLRALKIGVNTADLAAFEEVEKDWKEICTGFGLSPYLFGMSDTTFTNYAEAQKSAYQNTVIPEEAMQNEQITQYYELSNPLMSDYTHVECLQKSKKDEIDAFTALITGLEKAVASQIYTTDQAKQIIYDNINLVTDAKN